MSGSLLGLLSVLLMLAISFSPIKPSYQPPGLLLLLALLALLPDVLLLSTPPLPPPLLLLLLPLPLALSWLRRLSCSISTTTAMLTGRGVCPRGGSSLLGLGGSRWVLLAAGATALAAVRLGGGGA
jgi:hypothetical protein